MVVYQKASVGVHFILLYLFKERKKKSKTKRRNKVPQEKKKKKKSGKEKKKASKVSYFLVFNFNKRLEENKKVVSGIA